VADQRAWAAVLFTFVIVDMAIVSPTVFVDPVWNNSFGFFWFAAFLGLAFTVGRGNLAYVPLLFFMGRWPSTQSRSCPPSGSSWWLRWSWASGSGSRQVSPLGAVDGSGRRGVLGRAAVPTVLRPDRISRLLLQTDIRRPRGGSSVCAP
jgi:hypothetical protein